MAQVEPGLVSLDASSGGVSTFLSITKGSRVHAVVYLGTPFGVGKLVQEVGGRQEGCRIG